LIKNIFPDALFIFSTRDPLFTSQSILKSREDYFGDKNTWFSVMPKNKDNLRSLDIYEQVVKQVFHLEKQINDDLKISYPDQAIKIGYEDFCVNPKKTISRLDSFFRANKIKLKKRKKAIFPELTPRNKRKLPPKEFERLKNEINLLDWDNYLQPDDE
jgi:hypothetical protein